MFTGRPPLSCWAEMLQHYLCLLKSVCNLFWVVTQHSSAGTQRTRLSYAKYTHGRPGLVTFLLGILCDLASLWKKRNDLGILTLSFPLASAPRQEFKLSCMTFPFQEYKYVISSENDPGTRLEKGLESHRLIWISHATGK